MTVGTSLSYFTDLQGSQTICPAVPRVCSLSYFTDLQGSQTPSRLLSASACLVTLLIYKVLKQK